MKNQNICRKVLSTIKNLHTADKCLIIMMVILMFQLAHNLFFHEIALAVSNQLDVAIRTTTAAIFGYFISANFQNGGENTSKNSRQNHVGEMVNISNATSANVSKPIAKIGFTNDTEDMNDSKLDSGYIDSVESNNQELYNHLQIIIVAAIGITSLLLLMIAHNYSVINTSSVATISQLRDFVSGSVGFLIGYSTHTK